MPTPSGIASVSRTFSSRANSAAVPEANASTIPGHEVVDVAAPDAHVEEQRHAPPHTEGGQAHDARRDHEGRQQVEQRGLAGRGLLVAAARHLDRVERGAGALLDHLGRGARVLGHDAPAPQLADLTDRHRADRAERDHAHQRGCAARGRRVFAGGAASHRRNCGGPGGSAQQVRLRDLAHRPRRHAHHHRARAPRRRVTTAPAATNASSPISTPGAARRRRRRGRPADARAPQRLRPAACRPIVSSLVVTTPGADEHVLLDRRRARPGSSSTGPDARAPIVTSLSTPQPRPITAPAPIRHALAHLRLVAHDRALAELAPRRRRPRRRTRPHPAPSRSGSSGSRDAVDCAPSRGRLPSTAPSWISQPSPTTVPLWITTQAPSSMSSPSSTSWPSIRPGARSDGWTQCFIRRAPPPAPAPAAPRPPRASAAAPPAPARRAGRWPGPERGWRPSRTHSTKCRHSIRSGSSLEICGLITSPERVMYSP